MEAAADMEAPRVQNNFKKRINISRAKESKAFRAGSDTFPLDLHRTHIDRDPNFTRELNQALSSKNRKQAYTAVSVLLLRWENTDLSCVVQEIEDLSATLETQFGFETHQWNIPNIRKASNALDSKLVEFRNSHDSPLELIIIYYGGHGYEEKGQSIWSATGKEDSPEVEWSRCQIQFDTVEADVLFIFDCCHAASAIRSPQGGIREFLAACAKESKAIGSGSYTFTRRLIKHLEDLKSKPFSITELQSRLTTDKDLRHSPIHAIMTEPHKSIIITPLVSKMVSDPGPSVEPTSLHELPRALIAVYLNDTSKFVVEEWTSWLATNVPNGIGVVKLEGVFQSESALVLFSVPAFVWSQLPENPAYLFVGLVKSTNLLVGDDLARVLPFAPVLKQGSGRLIEAEQKRTVSLGSVSEDIASDEFKDVIPAAEHYRGLIDNMIKLRLCDKVHGSISTTASRNLWTYLLQTHFSMPTYAWQVFDHGRAPGNLGPPGYAKGLPNISTFTAEGQAKVVLFVIFEKDEHSTPAQRARFWKDLGHEAMLRVSFDTFPRKLFAMWVHGTTTIIEMWKYSLNQYDTMIILEKSEARSDGDKIQAAWNSISEHVDGIGLPRSVVVGSPQMSPVLGYSSFLLPELSYHPSPQYRGDDRSFDILKNANKAHDTGRSSVVEPTKSRPQNQFQKGEELWMENPSTEYFDISVVIVDMEYDEMQSCWVYLVKLEDKFAYLGGRNSQSSWVAETQLQI